MTFPWEFVLKSLSNDYGCTIGEPVNDRLPVSGPAFRQVTNLPTQASCPNGLPLLVLRPSLQVLGIDVDEFIASYEAWAKESGQTS